MSLGSFALGTDSFVISGILPRIAHDLGVSLSAAGLLITVFAAVYAVGAPVLAVATGQVSRRRVLISALTAFTAANVLAVAAPDYLVMMTARAAAAVSAPPESAGAHSPPFSAALPSPACWAYRWAPSSASRWAGAAPSS